MEVKPILLIEDDENDVILTQRALTRSHLANPVIVARDWEEALALIHGNQLPLAVLLDIKLPKMDGIEVLRRIRSDERTRDLPVVIMTSSDNGKDWLTGYELGINGYVRKPVQLAGFFEAVKDLGLQWAVLSEDPAKTKEECC